MEFERGEVKRRKRKKGEIKINLVNHGFPLPKRFLNFSKVETDQTTCASLKDS